MRSSWVGDTQIKLILSAMMSENRLAIEVSEATGLRIDDVLSIKTEVVRNTQRPTVTDSKTGKRHRVYIPRKLWLRMLQQAGKVWVWPGRLEPLQRHRTRQAVYKDMVQAAAIFRRNGALPQEAHVSPHTARKRAAVAAYQEGGLDAARQLLQHSERDVGVTLLYALANNEAPPKVRRRRKKGRA